MFLPVANSHLKDSSLASFEFAKQSKTSTADQTLEPARQIDFNKSVQKLPIVEAILDNSKSALIPRKTSTIKQFSKVARKVQKEARVLDDMSVWQNKKNVKMDETIRDSDILEFHGTPDIDQIRSKLESTNDQSSEAISPLLGRETELKSGGSVLQSLPVASVTDLLPANNETATPDRSNSRVFHEELRQGSLSVS